MKVVSAMEMREIDSETIEGIGIPGIVLMETAGRAIAHSIERNYPACQHIGIFVGKGNNGGDGLVIARQLVHVGRAVDVFLVSPIESFRGDALRNLQIASRLSQGVRIFCIVGENKGSEILQIESDGDVVFGNYKKVPN